jgi:hypothetical protein
MKHRNFTKVIAKVASAWCLPPSELNMAVLSMQYELSILSQRLKNSYLDPGTIDATPGPRTALAANYAFMLDYALLRTVLYGGRKGRSAARKIRNEPYYRRHFTICNVAYQTDPEQPKCSGTTHHKNY